jgi:hypothetical protein
MLTQGLGTGSIIWMDLATENVREVGKHGMRGVCKDRFAKRRYKPEVKRSF